MITSADFRLFISSFEQGTIVDRIDYNVQNVAASVEEGYKQLQKVSSSPPFAASLIIVISFHWAGKTIMLPHSKQHFFISGEKKLDL